MKTVQMIMVMLLASILVIGIVSGNNAISEADWGNATPADLNEITKQLSVSEQNNVVIAEKIKGYIREPNDRVCNFTHGNIRQLVLNENGIIASYFNLSTENQFLSDENVTIYRFAVSDADTTIITEKLAIYIFYKDCMVVGYAWGYAKEIESAPIYVPSESCPPDPITEAPVDNSIRSVNLSELDWGNATAINLDADVKNLDISEQNNMVIAEKIKGYIRVPTDGVYNFTHGNIRQLVLNENGTVSSYFNLSAENQFLWDRNITVYRFTTNDADTTITTKKIAIYIFYKDCKVVGFAWGYAEEIKSTPTYIANTICVAGQIVEAPTDSSGGGGGSGPSSGPSGGPSGPSGDPSGPSGPSDPGPTG